mgnify:CR=1 FL=1
MMCIMYLVYAKTLLEDGIPLLLVVLIRFPWLPDVLGERIWRFGLYRPSDHLDDKEDCRKEDGNLNGQLQNWYSEEPH